MVLITLLNEFLWISVVWGFKQTWLGLLLNVLHSLYLIFQHFCKRKSTFVCFHSVLLYMLVHMLDVYNQKKSRHLRVSMLHQKEKGHFFIYLTSLHSCWALVNEEGSVFALQLLCNDLQRFASLFNLPLLPNGASTTGKWLQSSTTLLLQLLPFYSWGSFHFCIQLQWRQVVSLSMVPSADTVTHMYNLCRKGA